MKRITAILAVLVLVAVAAAGPEAGAGWFGKDRAGGKAQRTEMKFQTHRFDAHPTLSFRSGLLQGDSYGGWRLEDGPRIVLGSDCRVTVDGEDGGRLNAGRRAVVVGSQAGGTIVAMSIRMLRPDWEIRRAGGEARITWSESDPSVGEGSGPN